jgi:predicted AlkP superfamily phosphohydrolase/phosphomutase
MLIGLDGATFDVIEPLVAQGALPHLGGLMATGAWGPLRSIVPPITGPAWSVLATGQNPGKLGIYDFLNRRRLDDLRLFPIRSSDFAGQTFWDLMGAAGYRIGVMNYPVLVPAYPVNGWMVSGLGASTLHDFTYPPELKRELDDVTGGYEIQISYGLPRYRDNLAALIDDLKELVRRRVLAVEHLLETDPVDALTIVFSASDVASHTLWKYWETAIDEQHRDSRAQELREDYVAIWRELDEAVGRLLQLLAPGGHVLVVSDHGFGPSHGVFRTNEWLSQNGYLVRQRGRSSVSNSARRWLTEKSAPYLGSVYKRLLGSRVHDVLRASVLREIDVTESRAFALDTSDACGGIFVNRQYARLRGLDEEEFVSQTSAELRDQLRAFGGEGRPKIEVFLASELYWGEKAPLAPELVLVVDDYRCSVSHRFGEPIYDDVPHHPMKSGTHRLEGILIAHGPRVRPGRFRGGQLQDVAPTLLRLADVGIPASADGSVLDLMLTDVPAVDGSDGARLPAAHPIAVTVPDDAEEDMGVVLERLRNLGYLD